MTISWFAAWRCGAASLEDNRDDVPTTCPDHPTADRLGQPEAAFDVDPARPRGLVHLD